VTVPEYIRALESLLRRARALLEPLAEYDPAIREWLSDFKEEAK
jgi:hypothetical protein